MSSLLHSSGVLARLSSSVDGSAIVARVRSSVGAGRPIGCDEIAAVGCFPDDVFPASTSSLARAVLFSFGVLRGVRGVAFVRFLLDLGGCAGLSALAFCCACSEAVLGVGGFAIRDSSAWEPAVCFPASAVVAMECPGVVGHDSSNKYHLRGGFIRRCLFMRLFGPLARCASAVCDLRRLGWCVFRGCGGVLLVLSPLLGALIFSRIVVLCPPIPHGESANRYAAVSDMRYLICLCLGVLCKCAYRFATGRRPVFICVAAANS